MKISLSAILAISVLLSVSEVWAQHPVEVQKLAAKGEHLKALTAYEAMPKRRLTPEAQIAAARSAWALGMTKKASDIFDKVLQDNSIDEFEKARIILARGIIEYQEGRYQVASHFAERAASLLPEKSALRARVYLLWGQSLERLSQAALAEEKLRIAVEEGDDNDRIEAFYALGVCQQKLGKLDEAKTSFENIPLESERTSQAIRELASIALAKKNYSDALFWLHKGRKEYTNDFVDSWVDYSMIQSAIHEKNSNLVRKIREDALKQHPPSDGWIVLLDAAAERYEWENMGGGS